MVNNIQQVLKYAFTNPTQNPSKGRKGSDGVPNGWRGWCAGYVQNALGIGAVGDSWVMFRKAKEAGRIRSGVPPVGAVVFWGSGIHVGISLGSGVVLATSDPLKSWDSNMTSAGIFQIGDYPGYDGWTDWLSGVGSLPTGEASGPEFFRDWQAGILRQYGYTDIVDNFPFRNTYKAIARAANYSPGLDGLPGLNTWRAWVKFLGW